MAQTARFYDSRNRELALEKAVKKRDGKDVFALRRTVDHAPVDERAAPRAPRAFILTPILVCNISGMQDADNGEAWQKEILLATSEPIKTETEEAEIKLADRANSG